MASAVRMPLVTAKKATVSTSSRRSARSAPRAQAAPAGLSTIEGDAYRTLLSEKPGKSLPLEWEDKALPLNTYSNKAPFTATVVSNTKIVGPNATGETHNVVIKHDGDMPYWEGQSYGVIPPGENRKKPGKPNTVRLYSIASTRYGDLFDAQTATLCVRRATFWDEDKGADDPEKAGVCSNFLCDATPGTKLTLTGPTGKVMLIPEGSQDKTHIMVATGTGIAPFRAYLRRMFLEQNMGLSAKYTFPGNAWLFMGVANTDALLYDGEFQSYLEHFPDQFRYDVALSREGAKNKKGGKMYIQDKVEEYADEVFDLLFNKGAHIYFCGLRGMMPGITEMLKGVAEGKGMVWEDLAKQLKTNNQWHVEVY